MAITGRKRRGQCSEFIDWFSITTPLSFYYLCKWIMDRPKTRYSSTAIIEWKAQAEDGCIVLEHAYQCEFMLCVLILHAQVCNPKCAWSILDRSSNNPHYH